MNTIGKEIQALRKKANLTQEEFSKRVGVGLRFVMEYERVADQTVGAAARRRAGADNRLLSVADCGRDFFAVGVAASRRTA